MTSEDAGQLPPYRPPDQSYVVLEIAQLRLADGIAAMEVRYGTKYEVLVVQINDVRYDLTESGVVCCWLVCYQ